MFRSEVVTVWLSLCYLPSLPPVAAVRRKWAKEGSSLGDLPQTPVRLATRHLFPFRDVVLSPGGPGPLPRAQRGCCPSKGPGVGWEWWVELGPPRQVEDTRRLWGAQRRLRPQLWRRVPPAPALTAVYGCCCSWAPMETSVPPGPGKVWATTEKVVAAWESCGNSNFSHSELILPSPRLAE